jgi:hypothetical protein
MSYEPTRPLPNNGWQNPPTGMQARPRRRRRRWPFVTLFVVIVLVIVAGVGDRVACAYAENDMANQFKSNGFPVKPHVTIEGIPFLTQLAAKDFNDVVISSSNVPAGPLTITSVNATLHGMHLIDGFKGARIDTIDGTALISFGNLASAGGIPSGITLSAGSSPNSITASVSILGYDTSLTAQLKRVSEYKFNVSVTSAGDIPLNALGNLASFTITVPSNVLPAGVTIQSVSVTQQGVVVTITGENTTFTQ